jgi:uncharacterized membrane protein
MKTLENSKRQRYRNLRKLLLKLTQFIALLLMGIELGVSYSHFLQMPGKAELSPAVLLSVQNVLIRYKVGLGIVEMGAMAALLVMLGLGCQQRRINWLQVGALLMLISAFMVWAIFIEPINQAISSWTAASFPVDWAQYRDRWHQFHLLRLGLLALGTSSLIGSVLTTGNHVHKTE